MPGDPVRRGPIESSSVWASAYVSDRSIPSAKIDRTTGSGVANPWADPPGCARAAGADEARAMARAASGRVMITGRMGSVWAWTRASARVLGEERARTATREEVEQDRVHDLRPLV